MGGQEKRSNSALYMSIAGVQHEFKTTSEYIVKILKKIGTPKIFTIVEAIV